MAVTEAGGVGPKTFQQLLLRFGEPHNFARATNADLENIPRINGESSERILRSLDKIEHYQDKIDNYSDIGIDVTTYLDDDYPAMLREIDDPPPLLYLKGNRQVLERDYVALVGTTKATQAGIRLAVDLARGFVEREYGIVSGLAAGIDSAAHLGALAAGGATIAVLGCGMINIFPEENSSLAENIGRSGLLVSEYDPYRRVRAAQLILRNRLITALSKAVVVVEIGEATRGELRTAAYASKQAKPLFFADPEGIIDRETVRENNALLIRDTGSIDEIIEYMV